MLRDRLKRWPLYQRFRAVWHQRQRRRALIRERASEPRSFRNLADAARWDPASRGLSLDPALYAAAPFVDRAGYDLAGGAPVIARRELHPSYTYARPAPELIDAEDSADALLGQCDDQRRRLPAGPAVIEATLADVVQYGSASWSLMAGELRPLWETMRENDRTAQAPLTAAALGHVRVMPDEDCLFLGSPGSHNYGHWLIDDLTRLPADALLPGGPVLLLPDHGPLMNARRAEGLALLAGETPGPPVRFVPADRALMFRRLRLVSPAGYHPALKSPAALAALRARMAAALVPGPARRVAFFRGAGFGRGLVNGAEIVALLDAAGFIVVDPVAASAAEQAAACLGADMVVGIMGAAMCNTIFSAPGTHVVHLAPRGWIEPFYWDQAAACGHRYTAIYGSSFGPAEPWRRDFRIDPASLARVLSRQ